MPCTTILVGKDASLDHAPLIARQEDYGNAFNPQSFRVILPRTNPATTLLRPPTSSVIYRKTRYATRPLLTSIVAPVSLRRGESIRPTWQ